MIEYLSEIWQEIVSRPNGPMAFRVYLQPAMSIICAIMSGLRDAKAHQPPYFYAILTDPAHRADILRDGWKSIRNVFLLAIALDLVYQITVLKGLRPFEGLFVAAVLAIVPYVLVRGLVTRASRLYYGDSAVRAGVRRG
jgi:hypothetical protein